MRDSAPRVVIVGGGFGGLAAAKALRKTDAQVVLVDRQNHHLFQPLLYQVATSVLSPGQIASPIRSILRNQRNTTVILGEVTGVDSDRRRVLVDSAAHRAIQLAGRVFAPHGPNYLLIRSGGLSWRPEFRDVRSPHFRTRAGRHPRGCARPASGGLEAH